MRRFIALVLCIALCFGLLAVPASAAGLDATHIYIACGFLVFS